MISARAPASAEAYAEVESSPFSGSSTDVMSSQTTSATPAMMSSRARAWAHDAGGESVLPPDGATNVGAYVEAVALYVMGIRDDAAEASIALLFCFELALEIEVLVGDLATEDADGYGLAEVRLMDSALGPIRASGLLEGAADPCFGGPATWKRPTPASSNSRGHRARRSTGSATPVSKAARWRPCRSPRPRRGPGGAAARRP